MSLGELKGEWSHLLVMGTGAGEMSGRGRCVSRQVGSSFSHDHSMARLMDTHTHADVNTHKTQTDTHKHVPADRKLDEMRWQVESEFMNKASVQSGEREGGYLGSDGGRGDVGGAVLVMVVVVRVPTSPPVVLVVVLHLLALGAALHGVRVGVRVGVSVGHGGGQLLQGGVRGLNADRGLAQQVDGVGQRGQDELKTLLQRTT